MISGCDFEIWWACYLKIPENFEPFFSLPPYFVPSLPNSKPAPQQSGSPFPPHLQAQAGLNDLPKVTRPTLSKLGREPRTFAFF